MTHRYKFIFAELIADYCDWLNGHRRIPPDRRLARSLPKPLRREWRAFKRDAKWMRHIARYFRGKSKER